MLNHGKSRLPAVTMPAARPNYINFEVTVFLRFSIEVLAAVDRYFSMGPHFGFKAFIEVPYLHDSNHDKLMRSVQSAIEYLVEHSLDLDAKDVMVIHPTGDAEDLADWEEITGYDYQTETADSKIVTKGVLLLPAFTAQLGECKQNNETMGQLGRRVMREYKEVMTDTIN